MSLNYKIYWIDDDDDLPKSLEETIKLEFSDTFIFDIEFVYDGENLNQKIQSEPIDLLILDYNLNGSKDGLDLLKEFRSSGELTEIIFYSQDPKVYDLCKNIVGVHVCVKGDAADKINMVISRFRDRTQNIAIMRGMIISEAIDLENKLTEIILYLFGEKSDLFRARILNKPILDFGKKHAFLNGLLRDLIEDLKKADTPETNKIKHLEDIKGIFNGMMKEVVNQRNILAHSKKTFEDDVLVLSSLNNDPPIRFNDEWKNQIRANIKKHLSNLVEIRIALHNEGLIQT